MCSAFSHLGVLLHVLFLLEDWRSMLSLVLQCCSLGRIWVVAFLLHWKLCLLSFSSLGRIVVYPCGVKISVVSVVDVLIFSWYDCSTFPSVAVVFCQSLFGWVARCLARELHIRSVCCIAAHWVFCIKEFQFFIYFIGDGNILCLLALWIGSTYFNVDITGAKLFQSASFIVPDSHIILIQFCFDVLVLVYLFCLFSIAECYVFLTQHPIAIFVNNQLDTQLLFLYLFIPILYMFQSTMCSSSRESIVSIQPLVYVHLNLHTTRSPTQTIQLFPD